MPLFQHRFCPEKKSVLATSYRPRHLLYVLQEMFYVLLCSVLLAPCSKSIIWQIILGPIQIKKEHTIFFFSTDFLSSCLVVPSFLKFRFCTLNMHFTGLYIRNSQVSQKKTVWPWTARNFPMS